MEGDLFEVNGAKVALRFSNLDSVRKLAQTLIADHSNSYDEAKQFAESHGVAVPTRRHLRSA